MATTILRSVFRSVVTAGGVLGVVQILWEVFRQEPVDFRHITYYLGASFLVAFLALTIAGNMAGWTAEFSRFLGWAPSAVRNLHLATFLLIFGVMIWASCSIKLLFNYDALRPGHDRPSRSWAWCH